MNTAVKTLLLCFAVATAFAQLPACNDDNFGSYQCSNGERYVCNMSQSWDKYPCPSGQTCKSNGAADATCENGGGSAPPPPSSPTECNDQKFGWKRCIENERFVCDASSRWIRQACPSGQNCVAKSESDVDCIGSTPPPPATPAAGGSCSADQKGWTYCQSSDRRIQCQKSQQWSDFPCPSETTCRQVDSKRTECVANAPPPPSPPAPGNFCPRDKDGWTYCYSAHSRLRCNGGSQWESYPCPSGYICNQISNSDSECKDPNPAPPPPTDPMRCSSFENGNYKCIDGSRYRCLERRSFYRYESWPCENGQKCETDRNNNVVCTSPQPQLPPCTETGRLACASGHRYLCLFGSWQLRECEGNRKCIQLNPNAEPNCS